MEVPDLEKLRKSYVWAWEAIEEEGRKATIEDWGLIATLIKAEMKTEKDNRELLGREAILQNIEEMSEESF